MSLFTKIKFMPYESLPATTPDNELYAVPFSLSEGIYGPDYAKKIVLSTGTTYTVGSGVLADYNKGFILAGTRWRSDDSNPAINFNGYVSLMMGCDGDYGGDLSGYCFFIPVKTGDYFYLDGSQGGPIIWFMPTKS